MLRLKQDIPLTEAEVAAVDDGVTAFDTLLTHLADVPTPAGPTPRQLEDARGVGTDTGEEGVMATTWVDFKQLKADVAIEQVLAHYGVHLRRIGATELRGRCPLPTHTSSRSRDSFAVNIARNVWSCRSLSCMQARGGRPGGNILDLVALMDGCSIRDAALRLQDVVRRGTGAFHRAACIAS